MPISKVVEFYFLRGKDMIRWIKNLQKNKSQSSIEEKGFTKSGTEEKGREIMAYSLLN